MADQEEPSPEEVALVHVQVDLFTVHAAHDRLARRAEVFAAWHDERKRRSERWTSLLVEQRILADRFTSIRSEIDAAKRDLDDWDTQKP